MPAAILQFRLQITIQISIRCCAFDQRQDLRSRQHPPLKECQRGIRQMPHIVLEYPLGLSAPVIQFSAIRLSVSSIEAATARPSCSRRDCAVAYLVALRSSAAHAALSYLSPNNDSATDPQGNYSLSRRIDTLHIRKRVNAVAPPHAALRGDWKWAFVFFLISIVATVFVFTGISAARADIARILSTSSW